MSDDMRVEINNEAEEKFRLGKIVLIVLFVFIFSSFLVESSIGSLTVEDVENWEVVFFDDFEEGVILWPVGEGSFEQGVFDKRMEDGVYRIYATAKFPSYYGETPWIYKTFSNFSLSVEAGQISGLTNGDYGVSFRENKSGFYSFTIYDSGKFVIYIYFEGEWERLKVGQYIPSGGEYKPRKITVIARGSNFYCFVNDVFLTQFEDDRLLSGKVGVMIGLDNAGDQAVFEFDNFEVRIP